MKDIRGRPGVSIRDIVKNINHKMKARLTRSTVEHHIKKLGMVYRIEPLGPKLTARHKKQRVAFAKKYLKTDWSKVIFSDEKQWKIFNQYKMAVWIFPGYEVPPREVVQYEQPIKTWGVFSARGKSRLVEYEGNLRAQNY